MPPVVLGLLHELRFGADAVEHLQKHATQELLGRDAGAPAFGVGFVHAGEQGIHLHQSGVDHLPDGPQRMAGRHEILQLAQGEQALGKGVGSAHEGGLGMGSVNGCQFSFCRTGGVRRLGSISAAC
ncbi:MAG: hypothetical protein BGP21_13325 [Thiobacillus sp. 65-29]|nr:MAG: hypothetical protein BGP21_13325 [Thiobacillus sp. 65-29]